jgi:phospholipid:diacylglycerol acyltransferase
MSGLRRRIFGSSDTPSLTPEQSREGTPSSEEVRVVSAKKLDALTAAHKAKKGTKRRNAWVFGLGGLFGLVAAGFFASSNEMLDIQALKDLSLDSVFDVLPAGLIKDAQELQVGSSSFFSSSSSSSNIASQSQHAPLVTTLVAVAYHGRGRPKLTSCAW